MDQRYGQVYTVQGNKAKFSCQISTKPEAGLWVKTQRLRTNRGNSITITHGKHGMNDNNKYCFSKRQYSLPRR